MDNEKYKKAIISVAAVLGVYVCFKYLLPLVLPFLLALIFAAVFAPQVRFLNGRLRFNKNIAAFLVMLVWGALIVGLLVWLISLLIEQVTAITDNYLIYFKDFNDKMCDICYSVDGFFEIEKGTTLAMIDNTIMMAADSAGKAVFGGSISALKGSITFFGVFVIFIMAWFFMLRDYGRIKNSICGFGWLGRIYDRMWEIISVFFKTQLIVMLVNMCVCAAGLFFCGNPYWLLIGVLLGLLDALPVFGTGTVLVPWAIINVLSGSYIQAGALLLICFVCYILRELLEPKLMGKKLGIHPLFMLFSVYAGIMLFGVVGVITGPIAFLLAKEIIICYN